jgi:hypothetical protein
MRAGRLSAEAWVKLEAALPEPATQKCEEEGEQQERHQGDDSQPRRTGIVSSHASTVGTPIAPRCSFSTR